MIFQSLTDEQQELYDGILLMMTSSAAVPVEQFCSDCPRHTDNGGDGMCQCSLNPYKLAVD